MSDQVASSRELRVAVIGLGWAAQHIWLPRLASHPAFKLTAVVDPDPAARGLASARAGVPALANAAQLRPAETDLAVVAVPNHLHAAVASPLLAQGVPVFVEKPVCLTAAEVATLGSAEHRGGSVLLAGSAARYRADIGTLREVTGSLGPIRHVELTWVRARGIPRPDGWFTDRRRSGGGAFVDLGWHLLDVAFALVGSVAVSDVLGTTSADFLRDANWQASWRGDQPDRLAEQAGGDVEDTARAFLVVGDGIGVSLRTSWASHQACDITRVTVDAAAGTASLECTFGFSPNRLAQSVLTVLRNGATSQVPLAIEPIGSEYGRQLDALPGQLADPGMRGHAITEAASAVRVIEQLYRKAGTSAQPTVRSGPVVGCDGEALVAATTPEVQRLREELAAAASGHRFVLYVRLPMPDTQPADGLRRMLTALRLATLDAVALLYSSGRAVVTLFELNAAEQFSSADRARYTAALADLIRVGPSASRNEVSSAQRRLARLKLPADAGSGTPAVIGQLGRAVTFMQAWGFDVHAIGQSVRAATFIAGEPLPSAGAESELGSRSGEPARLASPTHAVTVHAGSVDAALTSAAATGKPVVLRLTAEPDPELVTAWCDRLDPGREQGRLLISMAPAAAADVVQIARVLRRAGHCPAWVQECPASDRGIEQLKLISNLLGDSQLRLAGMSLTIGGRHLEYMARTAQMLADVTPARAEWEGARSR
jgi:oxidoreductase